MRIAREGWKMTTHTNGTNSCASRTARTGRPSRVAGVLVILVAMGLASCSDDIVCPDDTIIVAPAITASIVESRLAAGDHTSVGVLCVADPLPNDFAVFISGRQIDDVALVLPLALHAALEDDDIVWQHGQDCSLRVITDVGVATATEVVPGAFAVEPPSDIAVTDTLNLSWSSADGADYYAVRCVIRSARDDSLVLERSVVDTTVSFGPDDITLSGSASGWVRATAGPLPDGGTDGNIAGEGWGFFAVSYYDSLCLFEFSVTEEVTVSPR